jgi:hypothetical protein
MEDNNNEYDKWIGLNTGGLDCSRIKLHVVKSEAGAYTPLFVRMSNPCGIIQHLVFR